MSSSGAVKWVFPANKSGKEDFELLTSMSLKSILEINHRFPEMHCMLEGNLASVVKDKIEKALVRKLGNAFAVTLFEVLESPMVDSYRFCGGFMLHLCMSYDEDYGGDIDLYVVPVDDQGISKRLAEVSTVVVLENRETTDRTPQVIHDLKVKAHDSKSYEMDIVFRKEVLICKDIDAPCCMSGIVSSRQGTFLEVVDWPFLREKKMHIQANTSEQRREKLAKKGFTLVELEYSQSKLYEIKSEIPCAVHHNQNLEIKDFSDFKNFDVIEDEQWCSWMEIVRTFYEGTPVLRQERMQMMPSKQLEAHLMILKCVYKSLILSGRIQSNPDPEFCPALSSFEYCVRNLGYNRDAVRSYIVPIIDDLRGPEKIVSLDLESACLLLSAIAIGWNTDFGVYFPTVITVNGHDSHVHMEFHQ